MHNKKGFGCKSATDRGTKPHHLSFPTIAWRDLVEPNPVASPLVIVFKHFSHVIGLPFPKVFQPLPASENSVERNNLFVGMSKTRMNKLNLFKFCA